MRPKTKREAMARDNGYEYRHRYQQGTGAARTARRFTRRQSNRAMRQFSRDEIETAINEMD